jgi:hypothetical protein
MPDDKTTQADLDAAQAGLEDKLGQLKELVMDKVETVERPFQWLADNAHVLLLGVGLGIVLLSLMRRDE